jgi:hypothetical protein
MPFTRKFSTDLHCRLHEMNYPGMKSGLSKQQPHLTLGPLPPFRGHGKIRHYHRWWFMYNLEDGATCGRNYGMWELVDCGENEATFPVTGSRHRVT